MGRKKNQKKATPQVDGPSQIYNNEAIKIQENQSENVSNSDNEETKNSNQQITSPLQT